MVYECLTGTPPFSRGQIEYQIEHDTPEPLPRQIAIGRGVMAGLAKSPEARPATCAAVLEKDVRRTGMTDADASASKAWIAMVLLGVLVVCALVAGGWLWQERTRSEALRAKNEVRAAERARKAKGTNIAEEKRVAEKKRLAEENRKAEEPKVVVAKTSESVDRRRQEEVAKLTMARPKIAVRGIADEGGFEKVASSRSKRDGFEAHLTEIGKRRATVEDVQNQKALAPEKGAGGRLVRRSET